MGKKKLLSVIGSICLALVLAALLLPACAAEAPAPAPTPTPAPKPTPTPAPKPTPTPTPAPAPTPAPPKFEFPKILGISSAGVGSAGYSQASATAPVMEEWFKVPVRVMPSWSVPVNLAQINAGKASITSGGLSQGSLALACEGQSAFASEEWGPQRIMAVWQDYPCPYGIIVRGDSDITELTADQIRGKKMSWYEGSPGWQLAAEGCVRFAGLTLDDVQLINLGGYDQCARAVAEGKSDFAYTAPISTVTFEIVENPFGIRYVPMPFANKEGWKRYSEVDKYRGPAVCTAGVEEAIGIEMDYAPFTSATFQDMDEELVYQITKFFGEAYDLYKDKHSRNVGRRIEDMPATIEASCIPFHPGTVRYFKEVGIWTDEYEKWNNERTSWFELYAEAWDKALDAAYPKKIKTDFQNEEWMALWETYRYGIPRFTYPLR